MHIYWSNKYDDAQLIHNNNIKDILNQILVGITLQIDLFFSGSFFIPFIIQFLSMGYWASNCTLAHFEFRNSKILPFLYLLSCHFSPLEPLTHLIWFALNVNYVFEKREEKNTETDEGIRFKLGMFYIKEQLEFAL